MAGKTRKTNFFKRVYSPVKHAIMASKETVGALTNTTRSVACSGLSGLDRIGSSVATHANMAANDLLGRRRTRRNKKNTRRGKKAGRR
jgi:hypothetical protein